MIPKPWLDHYDEGVPATLHPYPRQTLVDVVDETTGYDPRIRR
jgi:long-chain acyl-CoA synthetase